MTCVQYMPERVCVSLFARACLVHVCSQTIIQYWLAATQCNGQTVVQPSHEGQKETHANVQCAHAVCMVDLNLRRTVPKVHACDCTQFIFHLISCFCLSLQPSSSSAGFVVVIVIITIMPPPPPLPSLHSLQFSTIPFVVETLTSAGVCLLLFHCYLLYCDSCMPMIAYHVMEFSMPSALCSFVSMNPWYYM